MTTKEWSLSGTIEEDKSYECLNKLDEYLQEHFDTLMDKFMDQFQHYCDKIIRFQEAGRKNPIGYIHFSILRTNITEKRHAIRMDAYDASWYEDRTECRDEYEVTEFYTLLDEFIKTIEHERKGTSDSGGLREIQRALFTESNKYHLVIAELIRAGLKKASETKWFQAIKRDALFVICFGDYHDQADILYKEDTTDKDPKEIKEHLEAKYQPAYTHEINKNLDLSGGDYEGINLLFSDFTGCDFSNSRLNQATILYSDFRQTVLKDTNLENTQIIDTDFSGAILENIDFKGASLKYLTFANAKLINVKFEGAVLTEKLNFDQAELTDTQIPKN